MRSMTGAMNEYNEKCTRLARISPQYGTVWDPGDVPTYIFSLRYFKVYSFSFVSMLHNSPWLYVVHLPFIP